MCNVKLALFMPWIMRRELIDSGEAGLQVHTSPPVADIRTIVLSSTVPPKSGTPETRGAGRTIAG